MAKEAFDRVLDLERKAQAPVLDFFKKGFEKVLDFERSVQKDVVNLFNKQVPQLVPVAPAPAPSPAPVEEIVLTPIEVNGFYLLSGNNYVTFYATTLNQNRQYITDGWTATGITGLGGQLMVVSEGADFNLGAGGRSAPISDKNSESYVWSFRIQSDTEQSVAPYQAVTGAILYPPGQIEYASMKRKSKITGTYTVTQNVLQFNFTEAAPSGFAPGWTVENLKGYEKVKFRVVSYTDESRYVTRPRVFSQGGGDKVFQIISFAILAPLDPSIIPENVLVPVNSEGIAKEPGFMSTFVPAKFTNFETEKATQKFNIEVSESIRGGVSEFQLRDLNTGFKCEDPEKGPFEDVKGRGFSAGSVLALNAIGPQEDHLLLEDFTKSQWNPEFKRYTNSVMYQRVIPFPPPNPSYQGQTIQLELLPTELGHLLSNMYLKVTMPSLKGYVYSSQLGRSLIKQVDLLVNETVIETLYDDWYIIRDQLFLDADEQLGMFQATNAQSNISGQAAACIGTGGVITSNNFANTVHTFTTNGTFTINAASTINFTVVGGGGAGANGIYQYTNSSNIYYDPSSSTSLIVPVSNTFGAIVGANTTITSSLWSVNPTWSNINSVSSNSVTLNLGTAPTWASYATGDSTITVGSNVFTGTTVTLSGINPATTGAITVTPAASSALVGLFATFVSQNVQINGKVSAANSSSITISSITGIKWIILSSGANMTIYNGSGGGGGGVICGSVFLLPGAYNVTVGTGGTQVSPNGTSSSFNGYIATGGYGGAYGGTSGNAYTSNAQFMYLSNTAYPSGGGSGGSATVTTGTGASAFTTSGTLGSGGVGTLCISPSYPYSGTYFGGGGGGASNTSITGTLATPGGLGGGGAGSSNVTGFSSQNTAAVNGTIYTGGGGGGAFGQTPGNGGSGTVILWYSATANVTPTSDLIIPLEFFFCRRKSHNDQDDERLRRPYFPLCAMWNQRLYVRFTFQPNTWWCNVAAPHTTDLVLPKLVTEEILLDNAEKLYYTNTPLKYIVNRVKKESTLTFSAGNPQLQLTASFPVQTLAWFFRNKNYEDVTSGLYSDSRYNYGYTTQYIQTGVQLNFPSGVSNYVDVIDTAKITLNNVDILSTFQGSLYYTFKQPMEHGLSIPSKSIYSYSFGLTPKEYNQGGYLNFSKLNSQTTTLTLVFNPSYTSQITQGYNLYMFYYGYTLLEFQGGFARLPYV